MGLSLSSVWDSVKRTAIAIEHVFFLLFGWAYTTRLYPHELENIHVVIIGCGYAGLQMAAGMKKWNVAFTIIEPKDYMHHCVAALRAAVNTGILMIDSLPRKMFHLFLPRLG